MSDNTTLQAIVGRLEPDKFDDDDETVLEKLDRLSGHVASCFDRFEFAEATQILYAFFWNDFCDWYVEVSKSKLQDPGTKTNCLAIQDLVLRQTLLLLHPFMPFITEELWLLLGYSSNGRFIESHHLEFEVELLGKVGRPFRQDAVQAVQQLQQFVSQARALKAEHNLASRRDVSFTTATTVITTTILSDNRDKLMRMVGAKDIHLVAESPKGEPAVVTPLGTLSLKLAGLIDPAAEKARLKKEIETITKHIAGTEARLSNEAFVSKAPPAVLEGARKQLAEQRAKQAELERLLTALG